uniref:Putative secreted protein n=1 Tax=Phlebotomus kandelakii TaxID=1109342 RepID=A0A6B2EBT7_9DIPT
MAKRLMRSSCLVFLAIFVVAECVPTSVLVDTTKDTSKTVKRSPEGLKSISTSKEETSQGVSDVVEKMPQKRGVVAQNPSYGYPSEYPLAGVPNGVWDDEPALGLYQDWDDVYEPANRHGAAYDNLQNLLNSQYYTEPVALPLEYSYKYYGDRKKRSSDKKHPKRRTAIRPKRNSKLSPADVMALASLLEGTERGRFYEPDVLESAGYPPYAQFAGPIAEDAEREEWMNNWANAPVEYLPQYAIEPVPRYEVFRESPTGRFGNRGFPAKRFMVSKKKLHEEGNAHKYF